jgi:Flp pilus assembly protein TadG
MKDHSHDTVRGQALVEFALAIPILLLLMVVIFDLGRAVYYSSAVHNAAREGARYGIIHPDDDTGMVDAAEEFAVGLGLSDLTITAGLGAPEPVGGINNPTVRVTVVYLFTPATPLVGQFLPGGTISLTGDAIMRTEALPSP